MMNVLCPTSAALIAVLIRMDRPDAGLAELFATASVAAIAAYGWCRLIDWKFARGPKGGQ
jgi:hypothetical protein